MKAANALTLTGRARCAIILRVDVPRMCNYLTWTVENGGVRVTNDTVNNSRDRRSLGQATKPTCTAIQKKIQKNILKVNYLLDLYFYIRCGRIVLL